MKKSAPDDSDPGAVAGSSHEPARGAASDSSAPPPFDPPPFPIDTALLRREKDKARELRDSAWWKRKRSSGICYYCGRKFPPQDLTMDHLTPLSRGGRSTKSNLVPCCKDCNNRKKNMLPLEWGEYLGRLRRGLAQPRDGEA